MDFLKNSNLALNKAVEIINSGGVVICPTDTVYGFLADAANKKAVEEIYKIKKRPRSKPLAVFVKDIKMAKELAEIDEKQEKILKKHWPGKFTFILKSKIKNQKSKIQIKNEKLLTKNGKIALRLPNHKSLLFLLKKIDRPLAQTSVNISGEPSMTKISDILEKFRATSEVALIINAGDLLKRKPSKIIDLTKGQLTRLR